VNSANILVVDDEPGMLRYLRTLLEVDSYEVSTAESGEEAVARVQQDPNPDVVLLDLLMPGLDGLQTLEQLRKIRPRLKVVMLSCVSDTRKVAQAIRLGAQDYLTKPFQKAEGTILLDEIGEMPPGLQAKLLHVLQDQSFSRLGGRSLVRVDVRILAATNIDIQQAIATKKLREDLYYRLNAFTLHLPPLRERREEIPLLLRHFMALYAHRYGRNALPVSPGLVDACVRYSWPGNLRELENFVKRYLILGDESVVLGELEAAAVAPAEPAASRLAGANGDLKSLVRSVKDEAEIEAITRALERTRWNRKEAARLLQISYKALLYKIRQYNIDHS